MKTMGHHSAAVVLIFASIPFFGCDNRIYADQELAAQERFGSIEIGATESAVRSLLGAPSSKVTRDDVGRLLFMSEDHDGSGVHLDDGDRSGWPSDLQFMPKRVVSGGVLVYADGTVTAFYFLSIDRRVEYVDVFTS